MCRAVFSFCPIEFSLREPARENGCSVYARSPSFARSCRRLALHVRLRLLLASAPAALSHAALFPRKDDPNRVGSSLEPNLDGDGGVGPSVHRDGRA